jgi:YggT family protein
MLFLAGLIHRIFQLLILVIIIHAVLSFFMDPYHPVRRTLNRIVDPLLFPIRRIIPPVANLDLSPIVLIILLQILDMVLYRLIASLA